MSESNPFEGMMRIRFSIEDDEKILGSESFVSKEDLEFSHVPRFIMEDRLQKMSADILDEFFKAFKVS